MPSREFEKAIEKKVGLPIGVIRAMTLTELRARVEEMHGEPMKFSHKYVLTDESDDVVKLLSREEVDQALDEALS